MNSYTVDRANWATMTIFEQLGNIYSEVGRSFQARDKGLNKEANAAMLRALDLFDSTVEALIAKKSIRAKEVLRAEDQYLNVFYGESVSKEEVKKLDDYFLAFAIAARLKV